MTTNSGNDALAQSTPQGIEPANRYQMLINSARIQAERVLLSHFAFPILVGLFLLDLFIPAAQGVALLLGVLLIAGLCGEEYLTYLSRKEFRAPASLGFYAGLVPPLVAFCWRLPHQTTMLLPPAQAPISLGLLTAATLVLVFCTLMLALSLIAEVSEKLVSGLAAFLLSCAGALVVGSALAHLLLLRQLTPDPKPVLVVLVIGWLGSFISRSKLPLVGQLPIISRFAALALAAVVAFWLLQGSIL